MTTFKDFPLLPAVAKALDELGFTQPTEIQQQAIPVLLSKQPVDIHGQAQTGTGKTLAFGIPLLHKIDSTQAYTQALIVAPTRELVVQICESLTKVARHMAVRIEPIYGGMSMQQQIKVLKKGVHIVVGTPGRLNDHLRRGTLSLKQLHILVLDEADIMLDMGFKEEIEELLEVANPDRQIWLFSATVKSGIYDIIKKHMHEVVSVRVHSQQVGTVRTEQFYCVVPSKYRIEVLCRFLDSIADFYGLIFCPTKVLTAELSELLIRRGYRVSALHGDMSQGQRNAVIAKFRNRETKIVIATDVAARGIDIPDLTHVINYALPDDQESYVHRVGRTGRAGKEGTAITFIAKHELNRIRLLERLFKLTIKPIEVPTLDALIESRIAQAIESLKKAAQEHTKRDQKTIEKLQTVLAEYSADHLKKILAHMVYDAHLKDLFAQELPTFAGFDAVSDAEQLSELFLSIGSDDGVEKHDIIALLEQSGHVRAADIKKCKVMRKQTFVAVPEDKAYAIVDALRGIALHNRSVRIGITSAPVELNDRRGGQKGGRGGRSSFGGRSRSRTSSRGYRS